MKLSYKVYEYKKSKAFYVTLNGRQVGPVYFSEAQVKNAIVCLKKGWDWK